MSQVSGLVSGAKQAPRRSGWSPVIFHMGNPELKGGFVGGKIIERFMVDFPSNFQISWPGKEGKVTLGRWASHILIPLMGGLTCHGRSNAMIRIYGRIPKKAVSQK